MTKCNGIEGVVFGITILTVISIWILFYLVEIKNLLKDILREAKK